MGLVPATSLGLALSCNDRGRRDRPSDDSSGVVQNDPGIRSSAAETGGRATSRLWGHPRDASPPGPARPERRRAAAEP